MIDLTSVASNGVDVRPAEALLPMDRTGHGLPGVFGAIGFGRFGYSAILPAMQKDLDITSAAAGSLASWNLGGYVLMAAVGGVLASRFGPRLVVAVGSIVAARGCS